MIVWGGPCRDCGAETGTPCDQACPSALAVEHEAVVLDLANVPEQCCPSASYAAATLCGCGGDQRSAVAS